MLKQREKAVKAQPDKQISETDPDSRLMKKGGGSLVGYNVQNAVDTKYKLIAEHMVTNAPTDRGQLLPMARLVQAALQVEELCVIADRGYYKGTDIKSCADEGIKTLVPKSLTSGYGANGFSVWNHKALDWIASFSYENNTQCTHRDEFERVRL